MFTFLENDLLLFLNLPLFINAVAMSDVLTTGGGLALGFVPVSIWRVDQAFLLDCVKSMLSTASMQRSLRVLSKCSISLFAVSVISSLELASWFNFAR